MKIYLDLFWSLLMRFYIFLHKKFIFVRFISSVLMFLVDVIKYISFKCIFPDFLVLKLCVYMCIPVCV